jgi:hypothetical protein
MILVDRGQKVRFLNFRNFGILFFIFLRMTSYLKMTITESAGAIYHLIIFSTRFSAYVKDMHLPVLY